jgi:ABC-type transport system involved in multi-copper enzyme maturation permease subunit
MTRILSAEFLKLKRSLALLAFGLALLIPLAFSLASPLIRRGEPMGARELLVSSSPLWSLGVYVLLVFSASVVFAGESQGKTIDLIFSCPHGSGAYLAAKFAAIACLLFAYYALSLPLRFLPVIVFSADALSSPLAAAYAAEMGLACLQFALLIPWAALLAVLAKRIFAAVLANFGFLIMFFPFHRTSRYYLFPFLVPVVHFSRTIGFDSSDLAFSRAGWISLAVFFVATLAACLAAFRRR